MADGCPQTDPIPTALYRHFDADGNLLYVGISLSPTYRLAQHCDGSHWFASIATVKIEWLPDRPSALEAERVAIINERPRHNVHHNRPALPEEVVARIEDSRTMLNRRMVAYKPLYQLKDAASEIGVSSAKLRLAAEHGEVRLIHDNGRTYITGWSLLDYMEALERGSVALRKMPARNPHGPSGMPVAA